MKKSYTSSQTALFVAMSIIVLNAFVFTPFVQAAIGAAPIASIGVGNGNTPANSGPTHLGVYNGTVSVYATMTDADNNLETYHFRVVKEGGSEGDTCSWTDTLSNPENQGYASSTLGKSACGFVFNQSVLMSATGFTNGIIATLNTADLSAFAGDGKYFLILGVRDFERNRSAPNYLEDPRVFIVVDSTLQAEPTPPVPPTTPVPPPSTGGGSGGSTTGGTSTGGGRSSTRRSVSTQSTSGQVAGAATSALGGTNGGSRIALVRTEGSVQGTGDMMTITAFDETAPTSTDMIGTTTAGDETENNGGFTLNWKWILAIILVIIAGFLIFRSTRERN